MIFHRVISGSYCEPSPSTAMALVIEVDDEVGRGNVSYTYRPTDVFGLAADVTAWLFSHPDFEIVPYWEPPAPEPIDPRTRELPRREFRRALLHNGMDTAAVEDVIGAITDPMQREEMSIWWQDTQMFQRNHPVLVDMVAAAGLTQAQADAIWVYGVGLVDDMGPGDGG